MKKNGFIRLTPRLIERSWREEGSHGPSVKIIDGVLGGTRVRVKDIQAVESNPEVGVTTVLLRGGGDVTVVESPEQIEKMLAALVNAEFERQLDVWSVAQQLERGSSDATSCGSVWLVFSERDLESWVVGVYATEEAALAASAKEGPPGVARRLERWEVEGAGLLLPYAVCPGCRKRYDFDGFLALRLDSKQGEQPERRACAVCGIYLRHYRILPRCKTTREGE